MTLDMLATRVVALEQRVNAVERGRLTMRGHSRGANMSLTSATGVAAPSAPEASTAPTLPRHSHMKWLAAMSLPCADVAALSEVQSFVRVHASARLHVIANFFDVAPDAANRLSLLTRATNVNDTRVHAHTKRALSSKVPPRGSTCRDSLLSLSSHVRVTEQPGHKTIFWRRELTDDVTSAFDLVWLLDCDVRVSPHLFSFSEVEHWLAVTRASIIQPSVVAKVANGRAGRGVFTRASMSADCLARAVPNIEQMTPIFRRGAFQLLHSVSVCTCY